MTQSPAIEYVTLGEIAGRYGCQLWQVRRLFERKIVPEARRIGNYRVVPEMELPGIESALARAGYIASPANSTAGTDAA